MSRYLILLLFILMSACSTSDQEGLTLSERTNTPSPIAHSPSVTPSVMQMLASATLSPSLTPTLLKPTATPSHKTATVTQSAPTATATVPAGSPTATVTLTPIEPQEAPMVVVPAGEFLMGSTYEQVLAWNEAWQELSAADYGSQHIFANELYQLRLYLDKFEIDQLEVTNEQYQRCVDAGSCERQRRSDEAFVSSYNTPAVNVTQKQAQAYCEWVGKRLPTEAEWEKAARGSDGRIYPWGNEWDELRLNVSGDLMAVGSFPEGASPYGALDMVGNAAEWTADFYRFYPGMRPTKVIRNGMALYRGGRLSESGEGAPLLLRVSTRSNGQGQSPDASPSIGFRCARGKIPPPLSEAVVEGFPPDALPTPERIDFSEMVPVPAGEFVMGTDEPFRHYASARPAHRVLLDEFYIDRYEVTFEQFALFLNTLGHHKWACDGADCIKWSSDQSESPLELVEGSYQLRGADGSLPAQVTWYGAQAYCQWLGKRLPTEAEWEKAARGTDGRKYPWGNDKPASEAVAYSMEPAQIGTHRKDRTPFDAFDMSGNVAEWALDWYDEHYYAQSPTSYPYGPAKAVHQTMKSVRGLAHLDGIYQRYGRQADSNQGFRCLYAPNQMSSPTPLPPTETPSPRPPAPTATPTPTPTRPLTPITAQEVAMVVVPAGEFLMGSTYEQVLAWNQEWEDYLLEILPYPWQNYYTFMDELYQFSLYLDEFSIDKLEVTNADYRRCVEAQGCSSPSKRRDEDPFNDLALGDYPVIYVTQEQAASYCKWAGKRLPTEAEWEKAARGSDGRIYPWGNEWEPERLNTSMGLKPVGSFPDGASPYGALDMVGNAAEWTSDLYAPYPNQILSAASNRPYGKPLFRGGVAHSFQIKQQRGNIKGYSSLPHLQLRTTTRHDPRGPSSGELGNYDKARIGFRCVQGKEALPLAELEITGVTPTRLPTQTTVDLSEMVKVPASTFIMGNDQPPTDIWGESEAPAHEVYLSDYYIDQYEVTMGEYALFLNALDGDLWLCGAQNCLHEFAKKEDFYWPSPNLKKSAAQVTWHGAQAYCQWLGKGLPTEAEWEKAARGTDGRLFPWGNVALSSEDIGEWDDQSPYGVFDMYGTALEWTADWFDPDYYSNAPTNNPTGPESSPKEDLKVVRSGLASLLKPITARFAYRAYDTPNAFRCAYTPGGLPEATATPITVTPTAKPTITSTPTATPTPTLVSNSFPVDLPPDQVPMVVVPAGEFLMGSTYEQVLAWNLEWYRHVVNIGGLAALNAGNGYAFFDESYQFRLYLDEFEIDKFEVINAHYKLCVEAAVCQPPQDEGLYLSEAAADYPVDWVSWEDATAYCEWLGKRLPTEAEWEKAARGTDGRIYPWGNEWDEERLQLSSHYRKHPPQALSDSGLVPVGSFPGGASPYGALDMLGNVAEWTATTYALYPQATLPKGSYAPVGEPVIRGGRLYYRFSPPNASDLLYRTALRHGVRGFQGFDPDNQEGFRCVRGAVPPPLSEAIVSTTAPQPLPTASSVDLEQMVLIPAGEFMMGTDEPERPGDLTLTDARPAHLVDLDEFYIDRYEVRWEEFTEYLNQLGRHLLACAGEDCVGSFQSPSDSKHRRQLKLTEEGYQAKGYANFPASATWYGASTYCQWLGKRLPTEAEWAKAARGSNPDRYPWGDSYLENEAGYLGQLSEVGTYPLDSSPFGLFDVLANAPEWTADWYDKEYYANSPVKNPLGPTKPNQYNDKVIRGGRARAGLAVRERRSGIGDNGFRCAYSP